MKLKLLAAATFLAGLAMAGTSPLKPVVITFPANTPDSVIKQAKDSIIASGGKITHEYTLLRGFAAEAPETTLNGLSTLDTTYKPHVEEDKVVSIS